MDAAAAVFAGLTSVLAKSGLKTLPTDVGLVELVWK